MPSKGFEKHKYLKIRSLQRAVEQFDLDKIRSLEIEPKKKVDYYRRNTVAVNFYGIDSKRDLYPDIQFIVWSDEIAETDMGGKEKKGMVVIIECEVNPNSQLLSDGLRKTAYRMLKETHKEWFKLILATYKGTPVREPEIFDEIWEFDKSKEESE
jgi:hypothetical protein